MTDQHKTVNRLAGETSPYLLQHRHNPVDWHPWGTEAFEKAVAQNKPVFLSVGYSTCYWCHVMERESFENDAVAAEMNKLFINIKVDREERPDVDALYMTAVQVLTRQGGWPMSVFLTPDKRPFYGGTYFPPANMHGRPSFVTLLHGIDDAYRNRPGDVEKTANELISILRANARPPAPETPVTLDATLLDKLIAYSTSDYEPRFGGFGHAPKFPRETLLELLLTWLAQPGSDPTVRERIRKQVRHTLDAMAHGGIRDQLGGGFHRYSTDGKWLVPHFEIMLYDNAMLGWVYAESYRQFNDPRHARIARDIFDFILREMTSPDGAFYTAFDAEVDAREGLSYLWTAPEIESILGIDDAMAFNKAYGLDRGPNFADPHHGNGSPETSILYIAEPGDETTSPLLDPRLAALRQKLLNVRQKRKQPLLDTKILTSWNALMIRAMAFGGKILGEQRYIEAAARAARYLLTHHRQNAGRLIRTSGGGITRDGDASTQRSTDNPPATRTLETAVPRPPIPGFLDDYAFFSQALLALADATGDASWRSEAESLVTMMKQTFRDDATGGFYFTPADADDLMVRQMTATDSPLPSGNAIAALSLLELGQIDAARQVIATFATQLQSSGPGMSAMLQAAFLTVSRHGRFVVSQDEGPADRPATPVEVAHDAVTIEPHWASPTELRVRLTIAEGFHINANTPGTVDMPLIPTELTIADATGTPVALEGIEYPPGEVTVVGFASEPLRIYSGSQTIVVRLTGKDAVSAPVRLSLRFQPCNENSCFAAVTKTFEVSVT